jgi:hypothetical protein
MGLFKKVQRSPEQEAKHQARLAAINARKTQAQQRTSERKAQFQSKKEKRQANRANLKAKRQAVKDDKLAEKNRIIAEEKARQDKIIAYNNARHQRVVAGNPAPIRVTTNLQSGEVAYLELHAQRMASVDSVIQETVGTTKKKGVIRRAVVGGALSTMVGLPGAGAIVGGATAKTKSQSTTTERTISNIEQIDSGKLIFTNKRLIFIGGQNVVALPYSEIIATNINNGMNDTQIEIKYSGMLNGEYYNAYGTAFEDTKLYYTAIQEKI